MQACTVPAHLTGYLECTIVHLTHSLSCEGQGEFSSFLSFILSSHCRIAIALTFEDTSPHPCRRVAGHVTAYISVSKLSVRFIEGVPFKAEWREIAFSKNKIRSHFSPPNLNIFSR